MRAFYFNVLRVGLCNLKLCVALGVRASKFEPSSFVVFVCGSLGAQPHKYPKLFRVLLSTALTGLDFLLPALTRSMVTTVRGGEGGSTHRGVVPNGAKRR